MKLERTATGIRLTLGATVREVAIPSPAHVAITRVGSYWLIWVNGILADSFILEYIVPREPVTIGPVDTVLDEIRVTPRALYTAPFSPPAAPHQAWYQGNPTFTQGRIVRNLLFTEGQFAGSKGSIIPSIPTSTSWTGQLYAGQGDRRPPYTGWDPADIVRLMEALRIPVEKLEYVQERLNQIQAISPQGQKRIQSLLAHRDGLQLELTRTLIPISTLYRVDVDDDEGRRLRARGSPWKNRYRSRAIYKKLKMVRKKLEVATGIRGR